MLKHYLISFKSDLVKNNIMCIAVHLLLNLFSVILLCIGIGASICFEVDCHEPFGILVIADVASDVCFCYHFPKTIPHR